MPYLAFNLNDGNEFVFDLLEERLSVGRDIKNDIVIDNTCISGFHAEFVRQTDGGYELVDLKSSNGTFVNGKRVERSRVKGGDKIRFGQLDSRFRERAPKGTAPATASPSVAPGKGAPTRTDGRRGDTESIPARTLKPTVETSPIELTKVPLARPDTPAKGPSAVPPPATIQRPAPTASPASLGSAQHKETEELRAELAKLKQEHDQWQVRAEKEKAASAEELAALRQKLSDFEALKCATAQQEAEGKKTEEALGTRTAELQTLEKQCAEAANKLQVLNTEHTQTKAIHEKLKTDLKQFAAQIQDQQKKADDLRAHQEQAEAEANLKLSETEARLRTKADELKGLETREADLTNKLDDLSATDTRLSSATEALKAVEAHKAEIAAAILQITQERDSLVREHLISTEKGKAQHSLTQTLVTQRKTLETQIHELESQQTTISLTLGKTREDLRLAEASLIERQEEKQTLETAEKRLQEQTATLRQEVANAEAKLTSLTQQVTTQEAHLKDLQADAAKLSEVRTVLTATTQDRDKVQGELQNLTLQQTNQENRLSTLKTDVEKVQSDLAAKLKELAETEKRTASLKEESQALEARLLEHSDLQGKLEETRTALTAAREEREKLTAILAPLLLQREEHEKTLPGLKSEVEALRAEMTTLMRDKQTTMAALEKAQTDRKAALEQTDALRKEADNLEKLLTDKRSSLEAETQAKLAEASTAENRLKDLKKEIEAAEARTSGLAEAEQKLTNITQALQETEKRRQGEEKTLSDLARQQETLRTEIARLEAEAENHNTKVVDLGRKTHSEQIRLADLVDKFEKAQTALQTADTKRLDAEASLAKAREEEKVLRKQIPALNTEVAGLQAMLVGLNKERDEASQFVTRLNVATENNNKKLGDLQQQISQLEEAHKVREERLMKAQEEVDREAARLKAAQEATRAAELAQQEAEKETKEARVKADAARTQSTGLETELSTRMDRIEKLKLEETRLQKEVEGQKLELQGTQAVLAELNDKIRHEESRLSEFTQVGGKILTLGAALAGLETRQTEAGKTLRDAAERELALQVKINALQESVNRETSRVEQIKKERVSLEAALAETSHKSEKQQAILKAQESEQRKRLADSEQQLHEQIAHSERLKAELADLNDRRAEFTQAEAQLRHWQEIEARLRGQLLELEEKHDIMRRGLSTEDSTVIMFANDLIKRIDLIDALASRYAGHNGGDVVSQIRTLRHSFEDILLQHGISEFDIATGTEVDVELRKRITVVESVPGKNKPRVVETCRSGFIYSREEGHEVILRKVEVRTSSH